MNKNSKEAHGVPAAAWRWQASAGWLKQESRVTGGVQLVCAFGEGEGLPLPLPFLKQMWSVLDLDPVRCKSNQKIWQGKSREMSHISNMHHAALGDTEWLQREL